MNKIYIINNQKSSLVDMLETQLALHNIQYDFLPNTIFKIVPKRLREYFYKKSLCKNKARRLYLAFEPIACADIYWHKGSVTHKVQKAMQHAKKIIVSSQLERYNLINKNIVSGNKIEVIYPAWKEYNLDAIALKQHYFKALKIEDTCEKKVIFYTSNNFKIHGLQEFLQLLLQIETKDFIPIIACASHQLSALDFILTKYKLHNFVKVWKLSKNDVEKEIDELLIVSDIFVYPTSSTTFANLIIKAMGYKNAVFVPSNNAASEVVDHFATMSSPSDTTTLHKIEALLGRNDLDYIKNLNFEVANNFTSEKTFLRFQEVISSLALDD